jgi:RNA polymerase sigma-70 factor (ECF subfamily)
MLALRIADRIDQGNQSGQAAMADEANDLARLLQRVEAGDEPALQELLERYEPRLRTAARVLLGPLLRPHLDTIDLVQSVHRSLLPGLREGKYHFEAPEDLVALALTILRRKVASNWRKVKVGQEAETPAKEAPDDPAQAAQLRDSLEHLLSRLMDSERQLIELRLEGLGTADIARRLNEDAHVLRARLSKLRQKLANAGGPDWF